MPNRACSIGCWHNANHKTMAVFDIHHPHDAFFRAIMSRVDVARDFLRHYLPPDVAAELDLDTLELTHDSFVDEALREHFSDLLFVVSLKKGGAIRVALLFEHKSYPEPAVALQLLRYVTRLWDAALENKEAPLPVIPVVFYHGKRRWGVGLSLHDYLAPPAELAPFVPQFRYHLVDVARLRDEDFHGEVALRLMLLVMKYIFRDDLRDQFSQIVEAIAQLMESDDQLYVLTVLRYLTAAAPQITRQELQHAVEEGLRQKGVPTMGTIAQEWIQEGRLEGMQVGRQEGLRQGVQQGLLRGIELALELKYGAAGVVLLPEIRQIDDVQKLQDIHDHIRTAATAEELRRFYQ